MGELSTGVAAIAATVIGALLTSLLAVLTTYLRQRRMEMVSASLDELVRIIDQRVRGGREGSVANASLAPVTDHHEPTYAERFSVLANRLTRITSEAERLISEMAAVVQAHESRRLQLTEELKDLTEQEVTVRARLETMSKEDIVGVLLDQERRHEEEARVGAKEARRNDLRLFLLGVVVTAVFTIIAVLLAVLTHHLGWT